VANSSSTTVILNGKEHVVERAPLRAWLELEDIRDSIRKAVEIGNSDDVTSRIYFYISTALHIDEDLSSVSWIEISSIFNAIIIANLPRYDFPLLQSKIKSKYASWDYDGRSWYSCLHLLASEYGWNSEYIADLDVDDAIALTQEILADEQLRKEWEWALSEKSVRWSKQGKGTFVPLERPDWMRSIKEINLPVAKIPKSILPVGNVIRWNIDDEPLAS